MRGISTIRRILSGLTIITAAIIASASDAIAQEPPSGEPLYVGASVDSVRPYIGQQIAYVFRIYRRSDFSLPAGETRYEPPGFTGFWNSEVSERREYGETISAHQYSVVELRTLLFPTVAGQLEIATAALSGPAGILESDPVVMDVRPLPSGAPPGFTGAVGKFEISVEVDTTTVGVNEPARVTVRISGEGNFGALPEPAWPEFQNWRLVDAPSHADSWVSDGKLTGARVYDLAMAPQDAGQLTIPAIEYPYFDPELELYVQKATSPIMMSVVGAVGSSAAHSDSQNRTDDQDGSDLRPLMEPPSALERHGMELTERAVYWAAWLVPTLLVAGALVWRRRQTALEAALVESRKRNARNALSRAIASGDDPAVAAADAILSYLSDRLGESLSGLTSEGLDRNIRSAGVPSDVAIRVGRALAEGETARFTPAGEGTVGAADHVERAIPLLTDLEEAIGA